MKTMRRKAQNVFESTVAFLAGAMIVGAAYGLFAWGVAHIPIRQITYEVSRPMASTPNRMVTRKGAQKMWKQPVWPTYVVSPMGAENIP